MSVFAFIVVVVTGFVGAAEFGSWAFVHPVIRRLPQREQVAFEKGLLTTFGRVMPIGMTLVPVLLVSWGFQLEGTARVVALSGGVIGLVALGVTIAVNVGINQATGHWDPDAPPAQWRETRRRWDRAQGVRSSLQLVAFVLAAAAATMA